MAAIMSVPPSLCPTDGGDEIALNFWTDNGHQRERESCGSSGHPTDRPLSPIRAFLGNHQAGVPLGLQGSSQGCMNPAWRSRNLEANLGPVSAVHRSWALEESLA